ncbi:hypothetical protein GF377_01790 [candidate division GN15 bacterium]|nr:hypothetical protein [candidate division GN15 bacterium]
MSGTYVKTASTLFVNLVIIGLTVLLMIGGCSKNDEQASLAAANAEPLEAASMELDGDAVTLAGVTFTPPSEWRDLGASGMRKADYTFGPVGGDNDSASLAVYYFGPDNGGGIDANIDRWIGQMTMPDGGDPSEAATRKTYEVGGMTAHHVELSGIYNVSSGPMMSGATTPKDGYLMSAVVLEAPEGNVFFKLTGPETSARGMRKGFMSMLSQVEGVEPAGY